MNHDFLIGSSQLNQAFESNITSGGSTDGDYTTRRTFIKRTGGATVATVIAWNMQVATAKADDESSSASASFSVMGGFDEE
jgi:hypothetical protein